MSNSTAVQEACSRLKNPRGLIHSSDIEIVLSELKRLNQLAQLKVQDDAVYHAVCSWTCHPKEFPKALTITVPQDVTVNVNPTGDSGYVFVHARYEQCQNQLRDYALMEEEKNDHQ